MTSAPAQRIMRGSPEFRRLALGLFAISAAAFSTLYCTQGVLPQIADGLHSKPDTAQLTVLLSTALLSVGMLPVSLLSERRGRRGIMLWSAALTAGVALLVPICSSMTQLLAVRAFEGFLLAGVPAIAMAYVGEECDSGAVTPAMGMYIAGGAFGGLLGRMAPAWIVDVSGSWRLGLLSSTALTVIFTVVFVATLPKSRCFQPTTDTYRKSAGLFLRHLRRRRLLAMYAFAFCVMGAYVSMYNCLPFRMEGAPMNIRPAIYSSLFLVNLVGTVSSRNTGHVIRRCGLRTTFLIALSAMAIGVVAIVSSSVSVVVLGTVLVTAGGFAAHTSASGVVASSVTQGRAQASALYMASFYGGSAIAGAVGSKIFTHWGWDGAIWYMIVLIVAATAIVGITKLQNPVNSEPQPE